MGNKSPCHGCSGGENSKGSRLKVSSDQLIYKLRPNLHPDKKSEALPENKLWYKSDHAMITNAKMLIKVKET